MKDIILIHGAWAGAWVWDSLSPLLRQCGYRAHAVELPGNGHGATSPEQTTFCDCVTYVENQLKQVGGPAFLVAHSGGGVIATQVAENQPDKIAGIAYVAGMMLPSGIGFSEVIRHLIDQAPMAAGIGPHLIWQARRRYSEVPPAAAREVFFQDVDDQSAWAAALRLTPQSEKVRTGIAHWTTERFGRVPRLYVEARQDRSVVLAAQRWMQQHVPGAEVASLNTGHAPQLAAPTRLNNVLHGFFYRVEERATKGMPLA